MTISLPPALCGLGIIALLAGCASGAVYQRSDWIHANADKDWDIDSAVCLQQSEVFTEQDQLRLIEIQDEAQALGEAMSDYAEEKITTTDDDAYRYLAVIAGVLSGSQAVTAEQQVQQEKFTYCMNEKGWTR